MRQKTKKNSSPTNPEKGIAFLPFVIIALGSYLGIKALDTWTSGFFSAKVIDVVLAFFVTLLQIPLALTNGFLLFAIFALQWVKSPDFISISYTKLDNPLIKEGWVQVRDLSNIGIVLALIVIALATILRIENYQAKKTLPILIGVALLINFTPVILGVIVDFSNIIMSHFLDAFAGFDTVMIFFKQQGDMITEAWREVAKNTTEINYSPLARTFVLITFGVIAGFLILIFAVLLISRYVAIWMAVILSPLAFLCYILPATRKYFQQWWNFFIQWCLIGITAAFFLWLSGIMMVHTNTGETPIVNKPPSESTSQVSNPQAAREGKENLNLFSQVLPYGVVLAFLAAGFFATMSISAIGAQTIIDRSKKTGKWAAGRVFQKGIRPYTEPAARKAAGWAVRQMEKVPALRWFAPEAMRRFAEFRPTMDKTMGDIKQYSSATSGRMISMKTVKGTEAATHLLKLAQWGDMEDLFKPYRERLGVKTDQEVLDNKGFQRDVGGLLSIARNAGYLNDIVRRSPRLGAVAAAAGIYKKPKLLDGLPVKDAQGNEIEEDMKADEGIAKATEEAREQHMADWEREELENPVVARTILTNFSRDRIASIPRKIKMGQETLQKTFNDYLSQFADELETAGEIIKDHKFGIHQMEEFEEHFKKKFGDAKAFEFFKTPWAKGAGWGKFDYKKPNERKTFGTVPATPGAATMGGGTGGTPPSTPPPAGRPATPKGTPPPGRRPGGGPTGPRRTPPPGRRP